MEAVSVVEASLGCEALHHPCGRPGHGLLLGTELGVHLHLELLLKHLDDQVRVAELLAIELDVGDQSGLGMEFASAKHVFILYPCEWKV